MPAHHEHYLKTEGPYDPAWSKPTKSSVGGEAVWRIPYLVEIDGENHDRVLEITEMVSSTPTEFVGRLATGSLVTVTSQESRYSIRLALES